MQGLQSPGAARPGSLSYTMRHITVCTVIAAAVATPLGCTGDALEPAFGEDGAALQAGLDDDVDDDDDDGPPVVDPARELLITDLSVVEDPVRTTWPVGAPVGPQAAWTFGRLIETMAGGQDPAQFCLDWLLTWKSAQAVNGYSAAARPGIQGLVIDPWLAASGGGNLDMRHAPFRLLAIVNRLDLRSSGPNGEIRAGEGRFVFGLVDPQGTPMPFTVIFEYGVPAKHAAAVKKWARAWHKLGKKPFGAAFDAALQKLTDRFTAPVCQGRPNASCLSQVRTNEVSLAQQSGWELREFRLSPVSGVLAPAPLARTPDGSYNGGPALAAFINASSQLAKLSQHTVSPAMLAAAAPASLGAFWGAPGILDNDARHGFALATCNGCHTAETGAKFLHVKNRAAGTASALSGFLTGVTVPDPVSGAPRSFDDVERRVADMQAVLEGDAE